MEVVERRVREREKVIGRARSYASSLEGRYSVFLVGSYARGDFNAWSDIDLVVIGEFKEKVVDRLMNLGVPHRFEVIPLTPEEAVRGAEKGNPLIVELVDRGVTLRDDLRIRERLKEVLRARLSAGSAPQSLTNAY